MDRKYLWTTAVVAVSSLLPLMLVHQEMWDGTIYALGYAKGDLSYLAPVLGMGKHITVAIWTVFHILSEWTGVPHKFLTNVLTAASIAGLSRETYKYLTGTFRISREAACFGAWCVLAFPAWHVFMSAANSDYVFYLWLFMAAANLRQRHLPMAIVLFVVSLQFYSLFAFAVGMACTEFVLTVDKTNYKSKAIRVFLFSAVLLTAFVVLQKIISVNGPQGGVNTFKLDRLRSFINYGGMAVVLLAGWFLLSRMIKDAAESHRLLRLLLCFLTLSFFAGLAYWAIGRPMRFFAFGSYTARHTIICSIPFALMVSAVADEGFKAGKRKVVQWVGGLIVTASVVLLYQGYDHKAAALLFKDMMVYSFQQIPEPGSGYVSIIDDGYEGPRHYNYLDSNDALQKAYGRSVWVANGFWTKRGHVYSEQDMREMFPITQNMRGMMAEDATDEHFTQYKFKLYNFHQEGRLWYFYNYLAGDFSYFKPRMIKM